MDALTRLDLYQIGRAYLLAKAKNIDPSTVDTAGSDANLFIGSQSFVAAACIQQLKDRFAALFIASARGDDLYRLLWDRFKLPLKGASPSVGSFRFYRMTTAAGAGTVPIGTKLSSLVGNQYLTTSTATFGPNDYEATCDIRSLAAGNQFVDGENQIRTIQQTSSLFDSSLLGTNDTPTAGGDNREQDDSYRNRGFNFWLTARRGTLKAIAYGAQSVAGISSAYAVEAVNSSSQPARVCMVYIADPAGQANSQLAAIVQPVLDDYRAGGIQAPVVLTVPLIVSIQLQLAFAANVITAPLTELIRQAIVSFVNSTPTSQPLYRGGLHTVLARFQRNGLIPNDSSIITPTGDLVPAVGETIRTTLANVTLA